MTNETQNKIRREEIDPEKYLAKSKVDLLKRLKSNGQFYDAGQIAEEFDKFSLASRLYEKDGWFNGAGIAAERAEQFERAIVLYEKDGFFEDAGRAAEKAGLNDRAIELYAQTGEHHNSDSYSDAGRISEKMGYLEKALIYYLDGSSDKKWDVAKKLPPKTAIKILEDYKEFYLAAHIAQDAELLDEAIDLWIKTSEQVVCGVPSGESQEARYLDYAVKCAEKAEQIERAETLRVRTQKVNQEFAAHKADWDAAIHRIAEHEMKTGRFCMSLDTPLDNLMGTSSAYQGGGAVNICEELNAKTPTDKLPGTLAFLPLIL